MNISLLSIHRRPSFANQHGFSKDKSCFTVKLFESINRYVTKDDQVVKLLSKLSSHGIRGPVLAWIDN